MPILWCSNSAANKDMMSKIWTNGDTIIRSRRKHCGKRGNCSLRAISPFPTMFSKSCLVLMYQVDYLWGKGLNKHIPENELYRQEHHMYALNPFPND